MKTPALLHIALASMLLATSCSQSSVAPVPATESSWSVFASCEDPSSVSGTSRNDVYALGYAGTLFHYDGLNWTVSMPFDSHLYWSTLWCASPRDIFAVGNSRDMAGGNWRYEYRVYHCDGTVASPTIMSSTTPIDLWGDSGNNVYAVGGGGMIQHYNGSAWQPMGSGTTEDVRAIWGFPTGELVAALAHSVLYYDGTSWKDILSTRESIRDIWGSSRDDVYAVGDNGAILHYDGQTWVLTRLTGAFRLNQVFGTAGDDVYAGGDAYSSVYHFDGVSWQATGIPSNGGFVITGLWASSKTDAFGVGQGNDEGINPSVFHFNGATWHRESIQHLIPHNRGLTAISGNDHELYVGGGWTNLLGYDGSAWQKGPNNFPGCCGGAISDIWTGSGNSMVVAGDYGYVWIFDGTNWTRGSSGDEDAYVWASSLDDVFKVAGAGISHFDGRLWQGMESGTTVQLHDVWGRSGADVYAVGDSGTVVHYDGKSWQRMEINTTDGFQAIWGNAEMAAAVGNHGTIWYCRDGQWMPIESPYTGALTDVWGASSGDIYAVGPGVILHYDGSRWSILSELGGSRVWGRGGDDVYVVQPSRIIHYGPTPRRGR